MVGKSALYAFGGKVYEQVFAEQNNFYEVHCSKYQVSRILNCALLLNGQYAQLF